MKVSIYARVSTQDQDNENQLLQLREYCERQEWLVVNEYLDEASAKSGERPQFKKLFADAHQKRFDLVLFWSLDRFSREGSRQTLNYLNELDSYGVGFKSFTEQYIDSTGVFKEAIIAIIAAIAKQERVRRSERTKAGLARAKAKGKRLGRKPISESKKADILRRKDSGDSVRKISTAVGVSVGAVSEIISKTKI